jgi:hypothetical protein
VIRGHCDWTLSSSVVYTYVHVCNKNTYGYIFDFLIKNVQLEYNVFMLQLAPDVNVNNSFSNM